MDACVENKALPVLRSAIRRLLAPLVKIVLRNGVPYCVFMEEAKKVFIDVADAKFSISGRKQSAARVAIITGISRKEVSRIRSSSSMDDDLCARDSFNRAARVISAWVSYPDFTDVDGDPLELSIDGDDPSFASLVRQSSGDMLVRAMLDELVRVGAVQRIDKKVRLVNRSYVPAVSEVEKLRILGTDVASLISTIDHNLQSVDNGDEPYFQRKVYYDNLPEQALPELRVLASKHGQEFIELMDRWIQPNDRDVNPDVTGIGKFGAGVGVFYFEDKSSTEVSQ